MIDGNTQALNQYERQRDQESRDWDIALDDGEMEAADYCTDIETLINFAAMGAEELYDALSARLQATTSAFDTLLDGYDMETCPRSVDAFIEAYGKTWAHLFMARGV